MKLAYIAGPFRAPTTWGIRQNVHRAQQVGMEVSSRGYMPVIPHSMTEVFHGEGDEVFWLEGTLALMLRCDLVVLVPNWEHSAGTREERRIAIERGISVFELSQLTAEVQCEG